MGGLNRGDHSRSTERRYGFRAIKAKAASEEVGPTGSLGRDQNETDQTPPPEATLAGDLMRPAAKTPPRSSRGGDAPAPRDDLGTGATTHIPRLERSMKSRRRSHPTLPPNASQNETAKSGLHKDVTSYGPPCGMPPRHHSRDATRRALRSNPKPLNGSHRKAVSGYHGARLQGHTRKACLTQRGLQPAGSSKKTMLTNRGHLKTAILSLSFRLYDRGVTPDLIRVHICPASRRKHRLYSGFEQS